MSMPKFPDNQDMPSRKEALNAIITSIAMEEVALARILNAESEKIERAIENVNWSNKKDREMIISINRSAAQVIERIGDLQIVLKNKLRLVTDCICPCPKPCPPIPPKPKPKPKPKPCKCISKFVAETKYAWSPCKTLLLCHKACCEDGVRTARIDGDFVIILPAGKRYDIELTMQLVNQEHTGTAIELRQISNNTTLFTKKYTASTHQINIYDKLTLFSEERNDSYLSLRLNSNSPLEVKWVSIEINSR
ncbi:MAG: hypothetical protein FWE34_01620 [Defluviitaleaceae bacterium]|nr:hypothetical protein [Defluviitaleaceae bacterium]